MARASPVRLEWAETAWRWQQLLGTRQHVPATKHQSWWHRYLSNSVRRVVTAVVRNFSGANRLSVLVHLRTADIILRAVCVGWQWRGSLWRQWTYAACWSISGKHLTPSQCHVSTLLPSEKGMQSFSIEQCQAGTIIKCSAHVIWNSSQAQMCVCVCTRVCSSVHSC